MIYKDFQNIKLSALGMGTMRLPTLDGDPDKIDEAKTYEMVKYALEKGVNYFDTAYMYHGGNSEIVMGKVLNKFPRESYYLADKFPGFYKETFEDVAGTFEKQLSKCGVEYFDFYLFHNVTERNVDDYMNDDYGLLEYCLQQKKLGRIKYLGFSAHGELPTLRKFLEKYGKYMEFCQLQINYIDWTFQKAKEKVELMKEYNIPVWVMEPVRGGTLASLPEEHANRLKEARPNESVVSWAFRFLQAIPEIKMILSGMSNEEQLKQNIQTFETDNKLNENEMALILDVAKKLSNGIPCTECRYCTTRCPLGLDIPVILKCENERKFTGNVSWRLNALPEGKRPSECLDCRACEAVCPQEIKIATWMKEITKIMKK